MSLTPAPGRLGGEFDPRVAAVVDALGAHADADPGYSFQAVAYRDGERVLDVWAGPEMDGDSLIVPFSVSKNTIGLSVALLVERGQLDLDALVSSYWPEFAAKGKESVTVRQLLSHQAGLPEAEPRLRWDELLDHHAAAARLAGTRPFWRPGSSFGYHAVTIGNLGSELVFRVTGRTLHEFFEEEIRSPLGLDVHLGLPEGLESRRVPVLPMIPPLDGGERGKPTAIGAAVFGPAPDGALDLGNDERSWRFGHPAGSATVSARGLARMFAAAVTGLEGSTPLLGEETVAAVGEQQVRGFDEVLGQPNRSHGIVFQKPGPGLEWGGPRSFGHDGALGCVACVDPSTGVAFGYTVARGPWPGGADPRGIAAASALNGIFSR